jgi:hypothetical protein
MATFQIALRTTGSLHPESEPDDFITYHTAMIRRTRDRDGKVFNVGLARAFRIHTDRAREAGESLFDVCDAHSDEMNAVYAALFDPDTDDIKEEVRASFDAFHSDILVLDYVLLSPRWRGLKLGLLATRKMIDLLGGGCDLAVSWVYPLNHESGEFHKVPANWIPRHASESEEKEARRKLREHFRQLGFRRIGKTKVDGLSLSQVTPRLADIIRSGRA